jgi:hypothetical protein
MGEKREVIKHSAAIHIQSNITLLQRRAWNVLLANAYDELPFQDEYGIKLKELSHVLEFDSKKEDYLKEALRALTTCAVEWDVLGKDGEQEWGITTLLAQAKIRNGTCTYAYSPELRRRLHNPRMYARISLSMQNKFESKHAQALWEVCVDYLDESRNSGETPFISLENYRKLMGVSANLYPEFKAFNRRVIKEPIEEINRVTDFHVEVVYKRKIRQIVAIKFKVRRLLLLPGQVVQQQHLFPDVLDMAPAVKELKDAGFAVEEAWRIWQEGFAYIDPEKRPIITDEDPEAAFSRYIREKIHLTKRLRELGKIRNTTGFLLEAIKKNYSNPEFAEEEKRLASQQQIKEKKERDRQLKKLEEEKRDLEISRDGAIHERCKQLLNSLPHLIEHTVAVLLQENPTFQWYYDRTKALRENYLSGPRVWVFVDQYVWKHDPEQFLTVRDLYDLKISALEQRISALQSAA